VAEEVVVVLAPRDEVLLVARQEPVLGPALAVLVDEGHHVLMLRVVMHVVVLRDRLGVAAGLRVRRDVVDHLAAAEHAATVADRLEVLLSCPDHVTPSPVVSDAGHAE
jgi:hypothetical protein